MVCEQQLEGSGDLSAVDVQWVYYFVFFLTIHEDYLLKLKCKKMLNEVSIYIF